jgi:hypothetical protein
MFHHHCLVSIDKLHAFGKKPLYSNLIIKKNSILDLNRRTYLAFNPTLYTLGVNRILTVTLQVVLFTGKSGHILIRWAIAMGRVQVALKNN